MTNMRAISWLPVALFVIGVSAIAAAVISGEAEVYLLLIFPVFTGSGALFLTGILLVILSFIAGFLVMARGVSDDDGYEAEVETPRSPTATQSKNEYGGVVMLGPVPLVFGSSPQIARIMLIIGIVLAIILVGVYLALFLLD